MLPRPAWTACMQEAVAGAGIDKQKTLGDGGKGHRSCAPSVTPTPSRSKPTARPVLYKKTFTTSRRRSETAETFGASRCRLTLLASKVSAVSDGLARPSSPFLCKTGRAVGLDREGVGVTEGAEDRWPLPPSPRVFCLSMPVPATASCMHVVHVGSPACMI